MSQHLQFNNSDQHHKDTQNNKNDNNNNSITVFPADVIRYQQDHHDPLHSQVRGQTQLLPSTELQRNETISSLGPSFPTQRVSHDGSISNYLNLDQNVLQSLNQTQNPSSSQQSLGQRVSFSQAGLPPPAPEFSQFGRGFSIINSWQPPPPQQQQQQQQLQYPIPAANQDIPVFNQKYKTPSFSNPMSNVPFTSGANININNNTRRNSSKNSQSSNSSNILNNINNINRRISSFSIPDTNDFDFLNFGTNQFPNKKDSIVSNNNINNNNINRNNNVITTTTTSMKPPSTFQSNMSTLSANTSNSTINFNNNNNTNNNNNNNGARLSISSNDFDSFLRNNSLKLVPLDNTDFQNIISNNAHNINSNKRRNSSYVNSFLDDRISLFPSNNDLTTSGNNNNNNYHNSFKKIKEETNANDNDVSISDINSTNPNNIQSIFNNNKNNSMNIINSNPASPSSKNENITFSSTTSSPTSLLSMSPRPIDITNDGKLNGIKRKMANENINERVNYDTDTFDTNLDIALDNNKVNIESSATATIPNEKNMDNDSNLLGATKIDQLMLMIQARQKGVTDKIKTKPNGELILNENPNILPNKDELVGGIEKPKIKKDEPNLVDNILLSPKAGNVRDKKYSSDVDYNSKISTIDTNDSESNSPASPQSPVKSNRKPGKKYECSFCHHHFSQTTHLEVHLRSHLGYKPFKCQYCDKRFTQGGNLRTHQRLHTGEKPYQCGICQRKFSRKGNLRSHLLTHNDSKPFICKLDDCNKSFTQLGNMKAHQNRFHSQTLLNLTNKLATWNPQTDVIPDDDKKLLEYFASIYKNSNKGIKGRGKGSTKIRPYNESPKQQQQQHESDKYKNNMTTVESNIDKGKPNFIPKNSPKKKNIINQVSPMQFNNIKTMRYDANSNYITSSQQYNSNHTSAFSNQASKIHGTNSQKASSKNFNEIIPNDNNNNNINNDSNNNDNNSNNNIPPQVKFEFVNNANYMNNTNNINNNNYNADSNSTGFTTESTTYLSRPPSNLETRNFMTPQMGNPINFNNNTPNTNTTTSTPPIKFKHINYRS